MPDPFDYRHTMYFYSLHSGSGSCHTRQQNLLCQLISLLQYPKSMLLAPILWTISTIKETSISAPRAALAAQAVADPGPRPRLWKGTAPDRLLTIAHHGVGHASWCSFAPCSGAASIWQIFTGVSLCRPDPSHPGLPAGTGSPPTW